MRSLGTTLKWTISKFRLTQAPTQGSFFYSESAGSNVDITNSEFTCFAAAYDFTTDLDTNINAAIPTSSYGGLFYLKDSDAVTSNNNEFK